jgi:ATP-dependent DNA helicase RecG
MAGTQQSGLVDLRIADLAKDSEILKYAREAAMKILEDDPDLEQGVHSPIKNHLANLKTNENNWSRIS